MLNGVGLIIVLVCIFGSFLISGGKFGVILHALPHEMMAIAGGAIGAFLISNSMHVAKKTAKGLGMVFRGPSWNQGDYRDLLSLLYALLATFRNGGATAIEPHLDRPEESGIFGRYPRLLKDHHLIVFICDYLRMMTVNFEDPNQLTEAMENDMERHHNEEMEPQAALQTMADGLPAIGIVAAVLGVIKTMSSIDQPTDVLGAMIGGALVGTFLGVLLSYCLVGPLAAKMKQVLEADMRPYSIVKSAIIAHANGISTQVAVEIARRLMPSDYAPTFSELETALDEIKGNLNAMAA